MSHFWRKIPYPWFCWLTEQILKVCSLDSSIWPRVDPCEIFHQKGTSTSNFWQIGFGMVAMLLNLNWFPKIFHQFLNLAFWYKCTMENNDRVQPHFAYLNFLPHCNGFIPKISWVCQYLGNWLKDQLKSNAGIDILKGCSRSNVDSDFNLVCQRTRIQK